MSHDPELNKLVHDIRELKQQIAVNDNTPLKRHRAA
jgi:hypothetical protein